MGPSKVMRDDADFGSRMNFVRECGVQDAGGQKALSNLFLKNIRSHLLPTNNPPHDDWEEVLWSHIIVGIPCSLRNLSV
jgi:hypothetical protein